MEETLNYKNAVSYLLKEKKTISELSQDGVNYINDIQDLLDEGKISYNDLRKEILTHLESLESVEQGSVAQYLLGCAGNEGNCSFRVEGVNEIKFFYDPVKKVLRATGRYDKPLLGTDTKAIIYLNDTPDKIDVNAYRDLIERGFKHAEINYRKPGNSKYIKIEIDDLYKHVLSIPERISNETLFFIFSVAVILLLFLFLKKF